MRPSLHEQISLHPILSQDEQEMLEMQLAAELLGTAGQADLAPFFRSLMSVVGDGSRDLVRSTAGQALGDLLSGAARQAIPSLGHAANDRPGTPLVDQAGRAGQALGLELEGLSPEDQSFEAARQVVRLALEATRRLTPIATATARDALAAFADAARQHAPGLLLPGPTHTSIHSRPVSTETDFPVRSVYSPEHTMHNLDRVLSNQEMFETGEFENFETGQNEYAHETFNEYQGESGQFPGQMSEMELAAELLSVSSEAELEQFFGKLIGKAFKGVKAFANSSVGKTLGGALRQVAKTALPSVGAALGSMIPIPGVGTAIGSMAGNALASALEMESGGVSSEDREFEVAQQVVRLATQAAQSAAQAPANANPNAVASQAVKSALQAIQPRAASVSAPGRPGSAAVPAGLRSGRWFRRGNAIVLVGA